MAKRFTPAQLRALDEVRIGAVTALHQESPHMGKLRNTWFVNGNKQHSPLTYDWLSNQGYIKEERDVDWLVTQMYIKDEQDQPGLRMVSLTRKGETEFKTQIAMVQHRLANQKKNMAKTAAARKAQGQKTND